MHDRSTGAGGSGVGMNMIASNVGVSVVASAGGWSAHGRRMDAARAQVDTVWAQGDAVWAQSDALWTQHRCRGAQWDAAWVQVNSVWAQMTRCGRCLKCKGRRRHAHVSCGCQLTYTSKRRHLNGASKTRKEL